MGDVPFLGKSFFFFLAGKFFQSPILRICFIREASNTEMDEVLKVYTENDGSRNI